VLAWAAVLAAWARRHRLLVPLAQLAGLVQLAGLASAPAWTARGGARP
jgi:hypothetical protein